MAVLLAACVTAFLISFSILPVIIKYSIAKNLVDIPGRRKIHKKITPSLGGIAIFTGFIVASFSWIDFADWGNIRFVVASLFILFLIGVRDDLVPFKALQKLLGQVFVVIILLFSSIHIQSLYGFCGIELIPEWLGYPLTFFVVIVITNSFNLIDGLDGLAGGVGVSSLLAFGVWFYLAGDNTFALFCFAMAGGTLSFLIFNWEPSEIFMGDTGAMVIGMFLSVATIRFMNLNYDLPVDSPAKFSASIATASCFMIVPLCDTLRIVILRLSKGQSPFAPDKSHIHHAIIRLGKTHAQASTILITVNVLYILIALLFRKFSDNYLIAGVIILSALLSIILDQLIIRRLSGKSTE
jgi:UDP-N-acetylmuramyl pentapeptide phosphotransferase/UDP-N-acetylglucosamine-1-phosphate transferase